MSKDKLFQLLSYKQLRAISTIIPTHYRERINEIAIKKYIEKEEYINYNPENKEVCVITDGEFPFPLFQVFFMESMIGLSIYCMYKNYRPIINFRSNEGINLWKQFLVQPCGDVKEEELVNAKKCEIIKPIVYFPLIPNEKEIKIASKLYKRFVRFNDSTKKYLEAEYNQIIAGKSVLGVLCRGTDYTANKPKGHPVQPQIEELIAKVKKEMNALSCDYIYLATEELGIKEQFEREFPGKILTNSRKYYDAFYDYYKKNGTESRISWVHHDRENDNYWKSLEYISSLNLLSKCKALIAGNCGGSRAALYMNGGKYTYWYLFDLGIY